MNKTYRLIWSEITHTWVAVSEIVKARGKRSGGLVTADNKSAVCQAAAKQGAMLLLKAITTSLLFAGLAHAAPPVNELPTGGQVSAGTASISQTGSTMTIQQSTSRAVVNWNTFNVGSGATVNIQQPGASAVLLNRVMSNNPSQIFGQINANGQVFLSNPSGVYFAPGSSVNVGGIVATTHKITDADFMSGINKFNRDGATGSVINEGDITAAINGYVALMAPEVRNNGVIIAQLGTVGLAAGEAYELQFDNNNTLTNIRVEPATIAALVENGNAVQAPGGLILLSAQAVNSLQGGIINNSGIIEANGLSSDGGRVLLSASSHIRHDGDIAANAAADSTGNGGEVILLANLDNPDSRTEVSGSISARAGHLGGDGGFIETSASNLRISDSIKIDASAPIGKNGNWLLDPTNITIASTGTETITGDPATTATAGDVTISASTIQTALATTNVTLAATNDININEALLNDTAGNKVLTLTADADGNLTGGINVNAVITVGAGDGITLNYGSNSNLTMARDDATNSFIGKINLNSTSIVKINGTTPYTVVHDVTTLNNMRNTLAGKYVLAGDLTAIGAFSPIGTGQNGFEFTGKFDGLGHTLSGMTITDSRHTGVFGGIKAASIQNIGVTGTTVTETDTTTGVTGGLIGLASNSQISNSFFEGTINGKLNAGGLIGGVTGSTIKNSYSKGTVNTTGNGGGLIGAVNNPLLYATALGANSVINSYSKSNVSSTGANTGGLIGTVTATTYASTVTSSYATGSVTNTSTGSRTGGLVGDSSGGTYTTSYATGEVSSVGSGIGGFIGVISTNTSATIQQSYSTSNVYAKGTTSQIGIGGFVGDHSGGTLTISNSYHEGVVDGHTFATSSNNIGGFLGGNNNGLSITNSYHKGAVSGTNGYIGGFIGQLTGSTGAATLQNNYAAATMNNALGSFVGGFVGLKDATSATTNWNKNFWDSQLSGKNHAYATSTVPFITPTDGTVTGKTTAQLQTFSTFNDAGWAISIDQTLPNPTYPVLVTENGITAWRIYSDVLPVDYTLTNILSGYTYNGSEYALSSLWSTADIFDGTTYDNWIYGTDYRFSYSSAATTGFTNAGDYSSISIQFLNSLYAVGTATVGRFVIDPKAITAITGITASNKVYNRSTSATLDTSLASFTGRVGADVLTVATSTGEFDNWNVGTGKTVSISGLTLGGAAAGNYNLTDATATTTANITAKPLTFTSIGAVNTTYGTPAATGAVTFSGVEAGDTVTASAIINPTNSSSGNLNAGTYLQVATLAGANAGNYSISGAQNNYVVNQLAIAGTMAGSSTIYGDALSFGAVTFTNVITGDVVGSNTQVLANSAGITDVAIANGSGNFNAGTYTVQLGALSGDDLANYSLNNGTNAYITGTHTIATKPLNVSGLLAENKVYNRNVSATITGTATLTSGASSNVDGLYYAGDTVNTTGAATGEFDNWNVGTGKTVSISGLTLGGASANNYSLNPIASTTANITQKPLTATDIAAVTTTYGTPAAAGAVTFTGVETGDTVSAIANILADPTNAYSTSGNLEAGTYLQYATLSGTHASNYSISYSQPNSYVVNQKSISGTMASSSTIYGDALSFGAVTFTNVITGDVVGSNTQVLANSAGITDVAIANGSGNFNAGTYTVQLGALSGDDLANYSLNNGTNAYITGTHVITNAIATVTGNSANVVYNANLQSVTGFTVSGLFPGDALTSSPSATGATGTNVGSYTNTVTGAATDGNYNLSFVNGALVISPTFVTSPEDTVVIPPRPITTTSLPSLDSSNPLAETGGGDTSSFGTVSSVKSESNATTGRVSIEVKLEITPSSTADGLVTVLIARSLIESGTGFSIPLPKAIISDGKARDIIVTLEDGSPLPIWMTYNKNKQAIEVKTVPSNGLPIKVLVAADGKRTVIEIAAK